jgi:YHS domain-containing protein
LATRFAGDVRALLSAYRCEEVKTIGDEVMIRVDEPKEAVELGLRIVTTLARPGAPPVRVGMHTGPAVQRSGDWFGAAVNLSARIATAAKAGEVLLSETTRRACLESDDLQFESRGSRYFRHVPEPIHVYRAVAEGGAGGELAIDPVCRMAVDPEQPAARRHWRGETYLFCSAGCRRTFGDDPRRYVARSAGARAARRGFLINIAAFAVIGLAHGLSWAAGSEQHTAAGVPLFVFIGALWAAVLVVHYRAVRRVL